MGKIKDKAYEFFICFATGIILGTLIGSLSISALISCKIDKFYERIAYLESEIQSKNEKLDKLEQSINKSAIVLRDIIIVLNTSDSSEEKIEGIDYINIEKSIKEKFVFLLGKEIKDIDGETLLQIIDKRIFKIGKAEYQISVQKLILTDILKLWVNISIIEVES